MRRCRMTNHTRADAPTRIGAQTKGWENGTDDASEQPTSMPPNATVERTNERRSRGVRRDASSRRSMNSRQNSRTAHESAASSAKKLRHPVESTMAPPIVGPIFGANPIATPAIPIAMALRPSGKCVIAIVCNTGSSMPAAAACITRPTNSDANPRRMRTPQTPPRTTRPTPRKGPSDENAP